MFYRYNTKKIRIFLFIILLIVLFFPVATLILAQSPIILSTQDIKDIESEYQNKLKDYGLSPEDVQYSTPEEIRNILNSKTIKETAFEVEEYIKKYGTLEEKEALNRQSLGIDSSEHAVDCFDYYQFGSVQTDLTAQNYLAEAGNSVLNFEGRIINKNNYPIVNGTLYIKIFRIINLTKEANGPDVVDQFVAVENVNIPGNREVPVKFSWAVPSFLDTGSYRMASFFTVNKKFNLLGLSFTDDIVGNIYNFYVNGKDSNVQFDKSAVKINGESYYFAAYPPRVESKDPAIISVKINNSTQNDQTADLTWKLYKWDAMEPSNLIRTISTGPITVKANSSKIIQETIIEASEPVYYLVAELRYKDTKSILNIRFVRPENDRLRINFPSITSFPIKAGIVSTMFSCLYNSGSSQLVPGGKLSLNISDAEGNEVVEYIYEGNVTGDMMAVKKDFVSKKILDHFFLTAKLWQGDKLVDESVLEYDCKKIGSDTCIKKISWKVILLISLIILIIIVFYIAVSLIRRKLV